MYLTSFALVHGTILLYCTQLIAGLLAYIVMLKLLESTYISEARAKFSLGQSVVVR
jgi:hypothetical protein